MRLLTLLAALFLAPALPAQDWPQWRGPSRDGAVAPASIPAAWPDSLQPLWRVEVGEGYSSPVVSANRVFLHSRRDPHEIIQALDLATGKLLWQQKYAAPYDKNQYASQMAKGPNSTPLVLGNRLFTLGTTAVLSAWDTQTGKLLWRNDYSASVDMSKLFCGTATSPLVEAGSLIVQVGSDIHGGRVLALDPSTGAERWTWRGPGPGYASPVVITVAGVRQIVALTEGSIVALDAKSGAPLWSVPFPDEWHENIVTPVWTAKLLIVAGVRQGTHAYSLRQTAGKWEAAEVWKNPDVNIYLSTPVFADGTLFALTSKRKGRFIALDASTGAVRWATNGREGEQASVLLTPDHVLFLTNSARLVLARRSPARFEEVRHYDVAAAETWAVPVLLPDGLIVRDSSALSRLSLPR